MKKTIGGDRLGAGKKMQVYAREYQRSTHNLSYTFTSPMAPGTLVPFMCLPMMRGDSFDINMRAAARTIPTRGPLFGSYKLQVDTFQCDVRLYQALLHNNPVDIGMDMAKVKFPTITIKTGVDKANASFEEVFNASKFNNSCLLKYLGMSGLGIGYVHNEQQQDYTHEWAREINAIPLLAYYDIYKNYYANKQEENAYIIAGRKEITEQGAPFSRPNGIVNVRQGDVITDELELVAIDENNLEYTLQNASDLTDPNEVQIIVHVEGQNKSKEKFILNSHTIKITNGQNVVTKKLSELGNRTYFEYPTNTNDTQVWIFTTNNDILNAFIYDNNDIKVEISAISTTLDRGIALQPFNLKNIDDMRMSILSHHQLGTPFRLRTQLSPSPSVWGNTSGHDQTGYPYYANFEQKADGVTANTYPLQGIAIKTYQNDIYNNWLQTEWIDGENGIAELTKISTAEGSFKIDALNLAEKLYNMLNRVAIAGGTYYDWQDAVYTQSSRRHVESPVYLGGISDEIYFEEIVQTAPAEGDALGTLGGKGKLFHRRGGHVKVKTDEAAFIMGIVSITPRIVYTQGNEWYLTDLYSMDDLHKPALDGIGYENLIGERLAWYDTQIDEHNIMSPRRHTIGKLPAWINYMTNVDKAYGEFADVDGKGFMILNRNYEAEDTTNAYGAKSAAIKDATTYIDPTKYNYAFAYTELDSMNFWVQIECNIKARRLMSAKQIPNV